MLAQVVPWEEQVRHNIDAITGIIVAIMFLIIAVVVAYGRIMSEIAKVKRHQASNFALLKQNDQLTDERVDLNNLSQIRRGRIGSIRKGLVVEEEENMGTLTDKAKAAYAKIAPGLRELRAAYPDLPDERFVDKIEKHFGEWLVQFICGPLHVDEKECWDMALIASRLPPEEYPAESGPMPIVSLGDKTMP